MPFVAAAGVGMALGLRDRVEAALVAFDDEIVLGVEMMVEAALGDVQLGRDALHRCAAIAEFVDQARGGEQEAGAAGLASINRYRPPSIRRRPCRARHRDAVAEHVHQPRLDAAELVEIVAADPGVQPERVFQQHMRARAVQILQRAVVALAPQIARAAEYCAPAAPSAGRASAPPSRADRTGRASSSLRPSRMPRKPVHVERQDNGRPRFRRVGCAMRFVEHRPRTERACVRNRPREIFLALEIIGHAGGVQPDAPRDIGEGHALRACSLIASEAAARIAFALGAETLGSPLASSRSSDRVMLHGEA